MSNSWMVNWKRKKIEREWLIMLILFIQSWQVIKLWLCSFTYWHYLENDIYRSFFSFVIYLARNIRLILYLTVLVVIFIPFCRGIELLIYLIKHWHVLIMTPSNSAYQRQIDPSSTMAPKTTYDDSSLYFKFHYMTFLSSTCWEISIAYQQATKSNCIKMKL